MNRLLSIASLVVAVLASSPARSQSVFDVEIAETRPGVRLTVDVAWSTTPGATDIDFAPLSSAQVADSTSYLVLYPVVVGIDVLSPLNRFLLSDDRSWGPEGAGTWDAWFRGTGIFTSAPGVFHLDSDYPGMHDAPTQLPEYPDRDVYGARFVFGEPYADVGVVPEASTWMALVPVGLAAGWAVRRRRSLLK